MADSDEDDIETYVTPKGRARLRRSQLSDLMAVDDGLEEAYHERIRSFWAGISNFRLD